MDIVKTIVPVLGPIWTGFTYLNDYDKNVQAFHQQVENLKMDRVSVQQWVDEDARNGKLIQPNVGLWLLRADQFVEKARIFFEEEDRENGRCLYGWWCVVCRYCRSSRAKEKTQEPEKFRVEGKFSKVSVPGCLGEMESTTEGNSKETKTRRHIDTTIITLNPPLLVELIILVDSNF
ncbi:unnamed protein product [Ilex paraguariensis]|uniref:Uncharacterized protein n=1 Tax=Ilex paraguariensis TaxID=185542 RepID=A0ABC8U899_9AQUA